MNLESLTTAQLAVLIGLLSVMSELFIGIDSGFDLVVIGGILIVSGFAGILSGNTQVVLVLTVILTLLYFLLARKTIKKKLTSIHTKTNIDKLVGDKGIVLQSIGIHKAGTVKIDGEEWRAVASGEIKAGAEVIVESVSGVTVKVKAN